MNNVLLDELIRDEKKIDKTLYSSGPYWEYKNKRSILEIKKFGLRDFRGMSSGVATSFSDNIVANLKMEFNEADFRGHLIKIVSSLPIFKSVFNAQLNITTKYANSYLENKAIVYKNNVGVRNLLKKYQFNNTTNFGCLTKFEYFNNDYSCHYLDLAHRISVLSKSFKFEEITSFFEIGGGFGANIHFLLTNFPNIKKVLYLDIVPNIYVGTEYLRHFYKNQVIDYSQLRNLEEIRFTENNELEILCVPPWLIEKVNVKVDHFHNAASFVEMPKVVILNYIKFVKKFRTKGISLISYDKFDPNTTFNPEKINDLFDKKLKVSWNKNLIEDYNRNSIYLLSK